MSAFRWLQVTNLHSGGPIDGLRSLKAAGEPFDAIVVTGGASASGDLKELQRARARVDELAAALPARGGAPIPVIAVPGDEDRARGEDEIVTRLFRDWAVDRELRTSLDRSDTTIHAIVARRFEAFAKAFEPSQRGLFPGDGSWSIAGEGVRVGVVALNTALASPTRISGRKLLVATEAQIRSSSPDGLATFSATHDIIAVVLETRPAALDSESQRALDAALPDRSLVLCGGGSAPGRAASASSGSRLVVLDGPGWSSGYAVGAVDPDGRGAFTIYAHDGSTVQQVPFDLRAPQKSASPERGAHITGIRITGFRAFESLDITLGSGSSLGGLWTCIAGINGAGKTSVLQAIALALLGARDATQLGIAGLARMRRRVDGASQDAGISLTMSDDTSLELTIGGEGPSDHARTAEVPLVVAYGATRNLSEFDDNRHSSLSARARRVITLFDPLAQVAHAEVLLQERTDSRVLALVSEVASEVFVSDLEIRSTEGRLSFVQHGLPVAALELPDGFRSSMAWLSDLCAAWCEHHPDSDDPRAIRAIVMIDEIDLHLHPSLQRSLVPRLRTALPQVQWIVTTHSPLVLGSFAASEIIALDRAAPGGVRPLDRQILAFSTNEIYEWLMGTTPASAALEREVAAPAEERTLAPEKLAEILESSPDVDAHEARSRANRRRDLIAKLKRGDL